MDSKEFFSEYGDLNRYVIKEVIGKGSYGVVCSAVDNLTNERVAIKKINNVFDHVSDATRILREIKLLRLLRHPDIVQIKHILLPPSPRDFKDIYVVFELMETDLHQVIRANDDLTPQHHKFFLYQLLRGMKYIHSAKVFHRDLKPKNILANSDCKLKICDFGLARPAFTDMPTTVYWTDYVATRWYRAPELCGSFFAKYTPAIDIWSIGCIFAEILLGKPLFPGRNVVHQLELITDLLGTPPIETINKVRNDKARRFLSNMKKKEGGSFESHFPKAEPKAQKLLKKMLSFDPDDRPIAEEALSDVYFEGLHNVQREPVTQPVSKTAFQFETKQLNVEEVRELIYMELLEYHPQIKQELLKQDAAPLNYQFASAINNFQRQFDHLENGAPLPNQYSRTGLSNIGNSVSLPKEKVQAYQQEAALYYRPNYNHGIQQQRSQNSQQASSNSLAQGSLGQSSLGQPSSHQSQLLQRAYSQQGQQVPQTSQTNPQSYIPQYPGNPNGYKGPVSHPLNYSQNNQIPNQLHQNKQQQQQSFQQQQQQYNNQLWQQLWNNQGLQQQMQYQQQQLQQQMQQQGLGKTHPQIQQQNYQNNAPRQYSGQVVQGNNPLLDQLPNQHQFQQQAQYNSYSAPHLFQNKSDQMHNYNNLNNQLYRIYQEQKGGNLGNQNPQQPMLPMTNDFGA